jgi:hypothetical protein
MTLPHPKDLIIDGIAVDAALLEARPVRRCAVAECQSHCCTGGVYISTAQADDILAHRDLIQPHLPYPRRDPDLWFDGSREPDDDHPQGGTVTGTTVLPDPTHPAGQGCVFLRPDRKCALQAAGLAAGEHPWRFKPFYCAMHPLVFVDRRIVLSDDSEIYAEGGSCNRASAGPPVPLYQLFDLELTLALGEGGYKQLQALATRRPGRAG